MTDPFLNIAAALSTPTGEGGSVTLLVRGMVVSGELVSAKVYCEEDAIAKRLLAVARKADEHAAVASEEPPRPEEDVEYIHLRSPKFFPSGLSASGHFCRIATASVDGILWGAAG